MLLIEFSLASFSRQGYESGTLESGHFQVLRETEGETKYRGKEAEKAGIEIEKMTKYTSGKYSNGINNLASSCNVFKGRGSQRPSPTSPKRIHKILRIE